MITDCITTFASQTTFDSLPDAVVGRAKICLYDWFIVAILGSHEPQASALENALIDGSCNDGAATIIGRKRHVSPFDAAFINGVNSHCLDYDDMHVGMNGHPGAVVFPALLAMAESEGASGRSLITGFAVGAEIACRLGLALSPSHYDRGWHATSTAGVFGAAVGAAKILNLPEPEMRRAVGLAGTQSCGLQRTFGTMGKPLNAGHAAACGLLSAKLAAEGLSAPADIFGGEQGYFAMYADAVDTRVLTEGLGTNYYMEDILIKRFPSCFSTHAPIEAALKLRLQLGRESSLIKQIIVRVGQMAINVSGIPKAKTITEAKFSIAYCVASALSRGQASALCFMPERIAETAVQELAGRVRLEVDNEIKHDERKATVVLEMSDGRRLSESVDLLSKRYTVANDWESVTQKAADSLCETDKARYLMDLRKKVEQLDDVPNLRNLVRAFF